MDRVVGVGRLMRRRNRDFHVTTDCPRRHAYTAVRNCPHCDKPATIVALLATPEAARPAIPPASWDVILMRGN